MARPPVLALAALLLLAPHAGADRVITADGRILTPKKAREHERGYRFEFEHGEILLPTRAGVQAVEVEGDMSEYVPKDDDEREKLAQGYVKYRSRWLSKPAFEEALRKEHAASKERADGIAAHASWHNAWTRETAHFVFHSNTSPEILDRYADLLEAYYDRMDERIGIKPTPTYRRIKMTVNVYRSYAEFHRLSPRELGLSPGVLGYFYAGDNTLNFYHDYAEPEFTEYVAMHECTHLLTFLIDQQYMPQIWLNEAIADYMGSAEVGRDARGRITIAPGKLQPDRILTVQQAIRDGKDKTLEELFFLERDNFRGFEYAHAWSFVYFLNNYEGGKYAKGFNKFFKGLYTLDKGIDFEIVPNVFPTGTGKRVPPEAIRDYLLKQIKVDDLGRLEKEWKAFIAKEPVEGAMAHLKRGTRSFWQLDFEEALKDLNAAIEAGIEDPRAWAMRGRARALDGDREGGLADLAAAVERDPLNAAFRYELAKLMVGELAVVTTGPGISIEVRAEEALDDPKAKGIAGLAMELDPGNDRYREFYERFE